MSHEELFWAKVSIPEDRSLCWEWTGGFDRDGYGLFTRKWRKAHRFSYWLRFGVDPGSLCVLHRCDVPACVNPAHLFLGTHSDNAHDRHSKGRTKTGEWLGRPKGSASPNAKLTEATVADVRRRVSEGERQADIARELGVCRSSISQMCKRTTWAHVA